MAYPFKRRKISEDEEKSRDSALSDTSASSSLMDRPLAFFSHGLQELAQISREGRRPVKIEEVHVKVREYQSYQKPRKAVEDAHHRLHRRQTVGGSADVSVGLSSPAVSVFASVGTDGITTTLPTTLSSGTSATGPSVTSTSSSDESSSSWSDHDSSAPSGHVPTSPSPTDDFPSSTTSSSQTTTTISSSDATSSAQGSTSSSTVASTTTSSDQTSSTDQASSTSIDSSSSLWSSSTTTVAAVSGQTSVSFTSTVSGSTNTTNVATSTSSTIPPEGMIGLTPTNAPPTSTSASISLSGNGTATINPTGLVPVIISAASVSPSASLNKTLTTSPVVISSGSTTFTSFSTFAISSDTRSTSVETSSASSSPDFTGLFEVLVTKLPNGQVTTITESRSAAVTTMSNGRVTTTYGSFVPVTPTTASSSGSTGSSTVAASSLASGSQSGLAGSDSASVSATSSGYLGSGGSTGIGGAIATSATATSASPSSTNSAASGGGADSDTPPPSVLAGGIVGGIAGLAALLLVALIFVRWYRRRNGAMQRISGTTSEGVSSGPTSPRGGPGMAERAGLLPLAAIFRGQHNQSPAPASTERGFQRVSGRKLPSAFSGGATGPSGPSQRPIPMPLAFENNSSYGQGDSNGRNLSDTSFFRDSVGFYGGTGGDPSPGDNSNSSGIQLGHGGQSAPGPAETFHQGPARQPTLHPGGPYIMSPTGTPPASPRANLLQGRAATPVNELGSPTLGYLPARSETPASHGSRFTEEV